MSAGERSCKKFGSCTLNREWHECHVACSGYEWDGFTTPDTTAAFDHKNVLVGGRGAGKTDSYKAQLDSLKKRKPYRPPTKNQAKRFRRKRRGK